MKLQDDQKRLPVSMFHDCSDSDRFLRGSIMNTLISKLDLLPNDRRREKRSRTLKSGKLLYGGFSPTVIDCLIIDMSDGGTRVETSVMIGVPEVLSLRLNDNIDHRARRCWAFGNQIGIEFLSDAA